MILVGVDVGTTAVKAAAFDSSLRELSRGRAATPWVGTELDPLALLDAAVAAIGDAVPADGDVLAVGVAGMAETGVLVDDSGAPVVPSIAWHDTRGAAEAARLGRELPDFPARTGLPASILCTAAKYAWMRANWPAASRGTRWISVADWIVEGLGGTPGAESSLASRTGWYDLHTGEPYADALAWCGAPPGLAVAHTPAGTPRGRAGDARVRPAGDERTGTGGDRVFARLYGAVLAVGGHDHLCAAVGADAAGDGDVLDSCGTAEAILRTIGPLPPDTVRAAVASGFTVGWHALERRWVLQGAVWSGEALQAVCDLLGVEPDARDALEQAALAAPPGPLGVAGLDDDALTITGVTAGASPGALYRATLERIGAQGADTLSRMAALAGPAQRLVVTGGWSEGVAARAVKARHLGPFQHTPAVLAGCRGAAMAAARALQPEDAQTRSDERV